MAKPYNDTKDIQHDLAMMLATEPGGVGHYPDLIEQFTRELTERGALLPTDAQWVFSPYAMGKQRLEFKIGDQKETS